MWDQILPWIEFLSNWDEKLNHIENKYFKAVIGWTMESRLEKWVRSLEFNSEEIQIVYVRTSFDHCQTPP